MYCNHCGAQIPDNSLFCPNCGKNTAPASSPHQQTPPPGWNQANYNQYASSQNNSRLICALAFIPILFWLPLVAAKENPLARHCANQGLLLLLVGVVFRVLQIILSAVLGISDFFLMDIAAGLFHLVFSLLSAIIGILILVCTVIGIINTYKGERFEIPIIGQIQIIK